MFIKLFVTIFSVLFYFAVLRSGIGVPVEDSTEKKIFIGILVISIQALIGANFGILLYHIWK